ncbi:MAG: type II secretion system protein GspD [Planctomycetota bacterium]
MFTTPNISWNRRANALALAALLLASLLGWTTGCNDHVNNYTKFGGWASGSLDHPVVISGQPGADSMAFSASENVLSDHDWQVLEKIAPRPIWERIAKMRELFEARDKPKAHGSLDAPRPAEIPDLPITQLPDGKVRFFYRLQNFGGPEVVSRRDGGTRRHDISLKPTDLGPLVNLVQRQLGNRGTVTPLVNENTLVVTCDQAVQDSVLQLIAEADSVPTQVEINVRVFEVKHDFDFQYGANLLLKHLAADSSQSLASTFNPSDFLESLTNTTMGDFAYQGSALRLMKVFTDAGVTLDATFQALSNMGLVKVVASPRMTVATGKTAYMLAGQEVPIQSAKISNDNLISQKVEYKPIGVQLYITPQASAGESVKMHVLTSVTAVAGFTPQSTMDGATSSETLTNPIIDSREAETYVTVGDGDTLVIGGLRMIRTVTREKKVPGLGQIALFEWLFKNHRSQNNVSDLYFFVQPRVVTHARPARHVAGNQARVSLPAEQVVPVPAGG